MRTRELQDEERAKLKMNRTKLQELMLLVDEIAPDTSYRQAAELLRTHEYFKNVRNDRDRQDIFNDVIRQKARDAKESEKKQRYALTCKQMTNAWLTFQDLESIVSIFLILNFVNRSYGWVEI